MDRNHDFECHGSGAPLSVLLWSGLVPGGGELEGLLPWIGTTLFHDAQVRDWYIRNSNALAPEDGVGRSRLKLEARRVSSPVGRGLSEYLRPAAQESGRVGGTANKTNPRVNKFFARAAKVSPVLIVVGAAVSVYEVSTADDRWRAAAGEIGSWAGALSVGYAGAQAGLMIGTAIGGPAGGAIGAIAGGTIGAIYGAGWGKQAGNNYYDFFFEA